MIRFRDGTSNTKGCKSVISYADCGTSSRFSSVDTTGLSIGFILNRLCCLFSLPTCLAQTLLLSSCL